MPAWTTPLEWPVWCSPTFGSRSSTATLLSGCRRASSRATASPTIPAPTTAKSVRAGGASKLTGADASGWRLRHPLSVLYPRRRSAADSGETPRGMSVRVRDLEIALVLAREMKAAAARSVDASLRLDQLQEVFGVEQLDGAERARIQTALQMAGLEPFPSLLEAGPTEPIRFGAAKAAAGDGDGGAATPGGAGDVPGAAGVAEPAGADEAP